MMPSFVLRIWTMTGNIIEFEFLDVASNKDEVRRSINELDAGPLCGLPSPIRPGKEPNEKAQFVLDTSKVVAWEVE